MEVFSLITEIILIVILVAYLITDVMAIKQVSKLKAEVDAAWMAITVLMLKGKINGIKIGKDGKVSVKKNARKPGKKTTKAAKKPDVKKSVVKKTTTKKTTAKKTKSPVKGVY